MSTIAEDALTILHFMNENRITIGHGISESDLKNEFDFTDKDFDQAIAYLLEQDYIAGAGSSDQGSRWITTDGIDHAETYTEYSHPAQVIGQSSTETQHSNQVFIVHGHDTEMKQAVAHFLKQLGLEPIILHERPNEGRTIIEKFEDYADKVGFAVVLLSPDDMGYSRTRNEDPAAARPRARQNVIFELGFFFAKLGRERVVSLRRGHQDQELETPSDYSGILYVLYDENERWQSDIEKELRTAGYDINSNRSP